MNPLFVFSVVVHKRFCHNGHPQAGQEGAVVLPGKLKSGVDIAILLCKNTPISTLKFKKILEFTPDPILRRAVAPFTDSSPLTMHRASRASVTTFGPLIVSSSCTSAKFSVALTVTHKLSKYLSSSEFDK